jgi:hypothetical protein
MEKLLYPAFGNNMKSEAEMNTRQIKELVILGISAIFGCKKPYSPPAATANSHYLVVQGVIAAGQDSTIITLSRTVSLSGTASSVPELNATVTVVSDQNITYPIPQVDSGKYAAPPLSLDNARKYSLHITTTDGHTYASDYEAVKVTPPIDTLGFNINATNDGINIYTNAHDPTNNTHYYRWDYTETYIYESALVSYFIFDPSNPYYNASVLRTPAQLIHTCYITTNSSTVLLNSSAALKQDVINNNPITQIPNTSEKLTNEYSIMVRQYALTQDAYKFWYVLKRNTEQIGTIFDVQPSEVNGNIHCTSNPAEPVIGYMSVSTISQKRIFIDRTELPAWPYSQPSCTAYIDTWFKKGVPPGFLTEAVDIPLGSVLSKWDAMANDTAYSVQVGYYSCVDCRYHNHGKTVAPSFWR